MSRLFLELRCMEPVDRETRLDEVRGASPALAREVESMLRHDDDPAEILRTGNGAVSRPEVPPETIGPYRILATLGEGGMGTVFLAEQEEPLRRRVAVKVIRSGAGTASARMRFAIERQVLARLGHPNVARVFDAGTTESGQPWFAMEPVNGPSITEYCDQEALSVEARLHLFLQACDGVHHAHQNAILHRDLKPGNVLIEVDGDRARPKVIDFGVAKALDEPPGGKGGGRTRQGQLLGTPPYMSPEQVASTESGVDVRSDVYSLGAILYELLCGVPPLDLEGLDPIDVAGIRRRIRNGVPLPPSRRIASQPRSVAACRAGDPERLARRLRGDLDAIVLKALKQEPEERYGSVPELAEDIRRHLSHEPVRAAPQRWVLRLRKAVRRHRAGTALVALLVLVTIVTSTLAWRLAAARARAETAQRSAEDYSRILLQSLSIVGPSGSRETRVDPLKLLEHAAVNAERFTGQPDTRVRLLRTVGDSLVRTGRIDEGRRVLDLARDAASRLGPENRLPILEVRASQGFLALREGRWNEAETALRGVIAQSGQTRDGLSKVRADARRDLVKLLVATDRPMDARDEMARLLEQISSDLGPEDPETLIAEAHLAAMETTDGVYERSAPHLQRLVPRLERDLGPRHGETLIAIYNLAASRASLGETEKAIELLDVAVGRGLAIRHNLSADPDLAALRGDPRFRKIVERQALNQVVADNHLLDQWSSRTQRLDREEAASLAQGLQEAVERVFGPVDEAPPKVISSLANANFYAGRFVEAEALYRRHVAILQPNPAARPADPPLLADSHWGIAASLFGQDDRDGALRELRVVEELYGMEPYHASEIAFVRASRLLLMGDRAGALQQIREGLRSENMLFWFAPERDLILRTLSDDPEFRAILAADRRPFVNF